MDNASRNVCSKQGYALRLGDGHEWRLIAGSGMESWLEQMGAVMQLGKNRPVSSPKVLFVCGAVEKDVSPPVFLTPQPCATRDFPRSGWRPHQMHLVRFWNHPDVSDLICEIAPEETPKQRFVQMREFLYWIYHHAMDQGGIPFHAGLATKNGTAYILSGPSQAGKSTCCKRIPSPWRALSDDEALVVRDQRKCYVVHPFPTWSDYVNRGERKKTWNVEMTIPLSAVFFLQQARTDEVVPLDRARAAVLINALAWPEILPPFVKWPAETMAGLRRKLFENACELALSVPSFLLRVSLTGRFWEKMEEVLRLHPSPGEGKAGGQTP